MDRTFASSPTLPLVPGNCNSPPTAPDYDLTATTHETSTPFGNWIWAKSNSTSFFPNGAFRSIPATGLPTANTFSSTLTIQSKTGTKIFGSSGNQEYTNTVLQCSSRMVFWPLDIRFPAPRARGCLSWVLKAEPSWHVTIQLKNNSYHSWRGFPPPRLKSHATATGLPMFRIPI